MYKNISGVHRVVILVEFAGFHGNKWDHSVTERLAEWAHVLSILQVYNQLSMQPVPSGVLYRLKVPVQNDDADT